MTKIIAAITSDAAAAPVLATANAIANLYTATVEAVHVGKDDATVAEAARIGGVALRIEAGTPVEALARATGADDVVAIVLGARGAATGKRPAGTTALRLITRLEKPAVVVPPDGGATARPIARILVPLDGTAGSAVALEEIIRVASDAAVEIVVAHVHTSGALPAFSDQLAHEVRAWSEEFIARNSPAAADATLEQRVGEPTQQILDILRRSGCDLVALAWNQDLTTGHAAVVRRMLAESPVPVILTPTGGDTALALPAAHSALA
jgi:hypothetical protein